MKVAFLWYTQGSSVIYPKWRDGLRSALDIVNRKHRITYFFDREVPNVSDKFDFVLIWGGVTDGEDSLYKSLYQYKCRKGVCLTTHPRTHVGVARLRFVDVVFVESEQNYNLLKMQGIRTIKAFGTDDKFFKPAKVKKDIEYFYPATFSPWKKQEDIAYLGDKLLCVGTKQPDGDHQYRECVEKGVRIELGYFPARKIRDYYRRAKHVIIPAIHGSERTVLEAMSMNILPEVTNPMNIRAKSYLYEYEQSKLRSPRRFILENYTAKHYAKALLKGIDDS